jgi:glycogen debranching enzyme
MTAAVLHPVDILFGGGVGMSCGTNGELHADQLHGLFAGDTRVLCTWRMTIEGHGWRPLTRVWLGPSSLQWEMQNPALRLPGHDLEPGQLHCRLKRDVFGGLHDCLAITSYAERELTVRLALQVDADFLDVFQVKDQSMPARLSVQREHKGSTLHLAYRRKDFRRGLEVTFSSESGAPHFVGSQAVFDLKLEPHRTFHLCLEAVPELDGEKLSYRGSLHGAGPGTTHALGPTLETDPLLAAPFARGCEDLRRLTLEQEGLGRFVAAGAPWFLALFGRDTLVTSLMAGLLGPAQVEGALTALAATQAQSIADYQDAEPGKVAHEVRIGELAHFHQIPHTPYYGAHDAPALFVLALWHAWRWTGDRRLVLRFLPAAEAALGWCDTSGDGDGDGLLEYQTHSKKGYRNQGWKDSFDAIPHVDGTLAELPIATVELQGYFYAARLAMAELYQATGAPAYGKPLREKASALRALVEERFWLVEESSYALALDGKKRPVRTASSNPGHLLWCGLPSPERAAKVAQRLLKPDLFSGYGVRSLSSEHKNFNPLSYQRGSVWPHDSALCAAGLMRYGFRDEAAHILEGVLRAAAAFEHNRLPELFCGFSRAEGAPVPYEKANLPQAWAAAVPLLAAQLFCGLCPDAGNGRIYLAPWLPPWLPSLELGGVLIAGEPLEVALEQRGGKTHLVRAQHPTLEISDEAPPEAPLWTSRR